MLAIIKLALSISVPMLSIGTRAFGYYTYAFVYYLRFRLLNRRFRLSGKGFTVSKLSAFARKNGNSNELAKSFAAGATEGGNEVEIVYLYDKTFSFCRGCLACQKTGECVISDDASQICKKMLNADLIVFATPVYYYSVSGQLKTMLDRANPLFASNYAFRDVYLLATAADSDSSAVEGTTKAVQGWVDCFEKAKLKDVVFAGGVTDIGEIKGHTALQKAFELGKNV